MLHEYRTGNILKILFLQQSNFYFVYFHLTIELEIIKYDIFYNEGYLNLTIRGKHLKLYIGFYFKNKL